MRNNLHVMPRDGMWVVLETGAQYELARLNTRERAINLATCLAEEGRCDLFLYDDYGQLEERVSYRHSAELVLTR